MFSLNRSRFIVGALVAGMFAVTGAFAQINNPGLFQSGAITTGHVAIWGPGAGQLRDGGAGPATPAAMTQANDTNVTLNLTGTPATSLLQAVQLTVGWQGTLAAGRLNSNVVQGVVNDTNITGSISAQQITLGWSGVLAAARLNANVVQAFDSTGDASAVITAQSAKVTNTKFSGNVLPITAGADSQILIGSGASNFIFSSIPNCTSGVIQYTSATHLFNCAAAGTGTVTSITCNGVAITTSGTCSVIGQVPGTATNDNASAGNVGQYASTIVLSGAAVGLTTATPLDIMTLTLAAGDWDLQGLCINQPGGGVVATQTICNVTTTANTLNNVPSDGGGVSFNSTTLASGSQLTLLTDTARVSIAGSTTYHLVMQMSFSGGTEAGYGKLRARRVR